MRVVDKAMWGGGLLALGLLTAGCGDDDVATSGPGGGGGATGGSGLGGSLGGGAPGGSGQGASGGGFGGGTGGLATGGGGATSMPCPADMAWVDTGPEGLCMDLYEAPNHVGELPLVMYTKVEAEAWCGARGKQLCTDDDWTSACEGDQGYAYPYGDTHSSGVCNDDELWMAYNQSSLNLWPPSASNPNIESLEELLDAAAAVSAAAQVAANHVEALYQGEPAGSNAGCIGDAGVYDLVGNVEEWTHRADGGDGSFFTGNLKGRYWAEPRTCQQGVKTHGDGFRFYEIGFRCCATP